MDKDGKQAIVINDQEAHILIDICSARKAVFKVTETDGKPLPHNLSELEARQFLPEFDFFQSAYFGNTEAVMRQASAQKSGSFDVHSTSEMVSHFQRIMADKMHQGGYAAEDVQVLHHRIKGFIRAQKTAPPRTLYIADCHFYHDRICREMDNRGFPSFEEMNERMIEQWNKKVTARDDVYILGDFSIARKDATEKILDRLKGKLHLIVGNHDKYLADKRFEAQHWFRSIEQYQEIRDNGRTVILSHYPIFCYKGQYRRDRDGRPATYMLYGHVHNTHDETLVNQFITETRATLVESRHSDHPEPIPCNMINCFCMFSNYQPMALDEWIEIDRKRRIDLAERDRAKETQGEEILYPNIKRVLDEVMGAAIARTSADEILEEGQNEAAALFRLLLETDREDDLRRAAGDLNYFRVLMKQYKWGLMRKEKQKG